MTTTTTTITAGKEVAEEARRADMSEWKAQTTPHFHMSEKKKEKDELLSVRHVWQDY
jgi:hypothetical protein